MGHAGAILIDRSTGVMKAVQTPAAMERLSDFDGTDGQPKQGSSTQSGNVVRDQMAANCFDGSKTIHQFRCDRLMRRHEGTTHMNVPGADDIRDRQPGRCPNR